MPKRTPNKGSVVACLPLALGAGDLDILAPLREQGAPRSRRGALAGILKRAQPANPSAFELRPDAIQVGATAVDIPGVVILQYETGNRLKGFNPSADRVFLVARSGQWFVEVRFKPRPKPKKGAGKKGPPKIYNDAALFVTGSVGHSVVSGGLPSLGKRR
jgi:hypothetical protein